METGNHIDSNNVDLNNSESNLISVIVPVYNGEAYLDRCVQSILMQTYQAWELLIVDGASTDGTSELCKSWEKKDNRIRAFFSEENKGVSAGRNTGIQEAKGEYLMFLDADDWLMPDCLERLYADIQEKDVQIAGCSFKRCSDDEWAAMKNNGTKQASNVQKDSVQKDYQTYSRKLISGHDFLKEGILQQDTRCWSKLYHKSVIANHRFKEDFTIGEDMLFLWEVARDAKFISSSEYPGYCYYYNVNGTMLKPFRESDIDQIRCWQMVLDQIREENMHASLHPNTNIYDVSVISRTGTILLMSCMLVVGKLSQLPAKERKKYSYIRKQCSRTLKEAMRIPEAYAGLDTGYRIKVAIFYTYPELYLRLYHAGKSLARK
ncbi:MAG: glycosyltransferase family 2 protein [Lachnospiraceae bacterium]|nr:glycosyltransferase family 2 protein [Lachnospiraceae bacterium]